MMGTLYYAVCYDCAEVFYIGKFWDWRIVAHDTPASELEQEILKETEELFSYFNSNDIGNTGDNEGAYRDNWIRHAVYVLAFLSVHNGHRITIVDEYSDLPETIRIKKATMEREGNDGFEKIQQAAIRFHQRRQEYAKKIRPVIVEWKWSNESSTNDGRSD